MRLGEEIREGFAADLEREAARKVIRAIEKWGKGGKIKTAEERWLFELIQNAIDITKERRNKDLEIEIITQQNKITFRHNAGYFTPQEIRALIYAYSTKPYDRESELAGKFATGFLVTHIVSQKVEVRGILNKADEYYEFETIIDRASDNIDTICRSFKNSFSQLDDATNQGIVSEYWTEYTYEATDDVGKEAIDKGISEVKKHLPFLLAFNKVSCVTVDNERYSKEERAYNDILIENVGYNQVYVKKAEDVEVAILVGLNDNKIISLSSLPKIYVKGLPLIETGYINIPFVIHSIKFETPEDRDTLTNIDENKALLKEAFGLYHALISHVSENTFKRKKGLYNLIDFQLIPEEKLSQNPLWNDFNNHMEESLNKIIENITIVETHEGLTEIRNTIFPSEFVRNSKMKQEQFGKFFNILKEIKKKTPVEEELFDWINIAYKLHNGFSKIDVILYGLENLKDEFVAFVKQGEKYPSFSDFNEKYGLENSRQYLLSFIEIVNGLYKQKEVSSDFINYLLLDQSGVIGPLKWNGGQLHIDKDIPDDFKDIVHKIGWEIRKELLDNDFVIYDITKDFVRSEKNTNNALEELIKSDEFKPNEDETRKEEWNDNILGWIELFRWCIIHRMLKKGFSLIVKEGKIKNIGELDEESFIVPFKYINIDEKYEEIFPESRIMHSKYFEIENSKELIERLKNYKSFVTNLPLYKNNLSLGYNKLESILKGEREQISKEHSMSAEETSFSFIPFLEQEVEGRVSQLQERGKLLFKFVVEHLINHDDSWEKNIQVNCACKSKVHKIIPSQWLASLKSDAWVPYKMIEDGEEKIVKREATKESIENLLTSDELNELIKNTPENITKFLPHFGFDELELKIKLRSIETGKLEEVIRREVTGFVDIADIVPDLSEIVKHHPKEFREAIEKLKEELERAPIKDENKRIGENLEKIIEKIFKDKYFIVKPIYRGGDLEIWPEAEEGWDSGLIEINPYLMEVKFTSGSRVHLSKTQSEMARSKKEDYIVLVVENTGNLRESLLEIDVNSISDDIISNVIANSHVIEGIHSKLGDIPNPEEVEPDINGYWVKKKLWMSDKNDITTWISQKFGDGV